MSSNVRMSFEIPENKTIYRGGEFVSGNLILDVGSEVDFRMVTIKFSGSAYVHWTESSGTGDDRRTSNYTGSETYFSQEVVLMSSDGRKLPLGRHAFPFTYQLPGNLPASTEVQGGYVRYLVEGKVDRSGLFSDILCKFLFNVVDILDLNYNPSLWQPCSAADSKTLCCGCCASGPIEGKISINKTGFVPGEFIVVNATIENLSRTDLLGSNFSIQKMITQHSAIRSRVVYEECTRVLGPGCKKRSSVNISEEKIQVPLLQPSHLRFCNIFDIQYFVQFCLETPTLSINLRVRVPIEIGSVPLRQDGGAVPIGANPPALTNPPYPQAQGVHLQNQAVAYKPSTPAMPTNYSAAPPVANQPFLAQQ